MKKLLILLLLLVTSATWGSDWVNPYDPGAARKDFSNVTPAVGLSALGLDLRLDTGNASFTGDIDITGDVGAATLGITGHSTLTTASATVSSVVSTTAQGLTKAITATMLASDVVALDSSFYSGTIQLCNLSTGGSMVGVYLPTGVTIISGDAAITNTFDSVNAINVYVDTGVLYVQMNRTSESPGQIRVILTSHRGL